MNLLKILFVLLFITVIQNTALGDTTMTKWKIEPSLKYDACCFLNILTGDEFYLEYYRADYDKFKEKLTPEVKTALGSLRKKIKEDKGTIISAWLCLYFSAVPDENLQDILKTLDDPSVLKENFSKTPYHNAEGWDMFQSVKGELKTIFQYLIKIDFEGYWRENVLPVVTAAINEIKPDLPGYDVIKETQQHLGFTLPSDTITVYMLYFAKPHGIKITGTRFLTNAGWPFSVVLRTSVHEMMHPPYDLQNDAELKSLIEGFRADEFLMDKVTNHNPSFGYNTLEGLFEEDCVQSLDQVINEKFGYAKDARTRWKESDEGIHVLAIALYQVMKQLDYNKNNEKFRDFLIRIVSEGTLSPGMVKSFYDKFYQ